jgi:hypothetical protein
MIRIHDEAGTIGGCTASATAPLGKANLAIEILVFLGKKEMFNVFNVDSTSRTTLLACEWFATTGKRAAAAAAMTCSTGSSDIATVVR